ncbi:response regulator transcription factor [Streptomyces sp. NPDC008122]|uniref:response regulator transcription factor n=1 Tax=Streptomyces sp. NPDC008122 TaxID=3364810 RepID=UPI0036E271B7
MDSTGRSPPPPRELEILDLIGRGLTNRQIGERLFLAEKTVENRVSSLPGFLQPQGPPGRVVRERMLTRATWAACPGVLVIR